MESRERAYWEGQRDATKAALIELQRGPWWHLRDLIARGLHWLAIHIEPNR